MRLLFIADGRSPIALNWIRHFVDGRHEVHLVSSYPCRAGLAFTSLSFLSIAFSGMAKPKSDTPSSRMPGGARTIGLRSAIRHWLGPLTVPSAARRLQEKIESIKPDLVHAMRIPFEGMVAAIANPAAPLVVSVWGNDLTLHAPASPGMRYLTRRALRRADALLADCFRDRRLAHKWDFPDDRVASVLPGAGGIRKELFHPLHSSGDLREGRESSKLIDVRDGETVVVNPRGFRAYVRNDTFFKAIPLILRERPDTIFICPSMAGEKRAQTWITRLNIHHAVRLLPKLEPLEMAMIFRRAQITVSPSEHDGTPNTLLEAMACGSFPVAGDLESIREWIDDGVNGFLIDPDDAASLAVAVLKAITEPGLRSSAVLHNQRIIEERAAYRVVMAEAEEFYSQLLN
jgi:glycosyltransferase involved in cell wall biosynthesis